MRLFEMVAFALSAVSAEPIDFKGYALGSPLDSFRARPGPPFAHPVCSDTSSHGWLKPTPAMSRAGLVRCSFERVIGESRVRADIPLSPTTYSATVEFQFYEGRLFRVETYMDASAAATIAEALTAKFGQPAELRQGSFQTMVGAIFPQAIRIWRRGAQTVTFAAPDLTTQRMSVIYLDLAASEKLAARIREIVDPALVM